MGTQFTNEMDFCFPNHKFLTKLFLLVHIKQCYLKFYEVFVLSISTRNAFPIMYAYKIKKNYSFNLLLNTLVSKKWKHLRLHQSRVHDRRNYFFKLTFTKCKLHIIKYYYVLFPINFFPRVQNQIAPSL